MHPVTHTKHSSLLAKQVEMKSKVLLVLLFINGIGLSFAGDDGNGRTKPRRPPIHDRLKLYLHWPNSYCFSGNDCRDKVPQYFTIKSLSAQVVVNRTTYTYEDATYCDTSYVLEDSLINKYKYDLLKYWRDLSTYNYDNGKEMWKEQWIKYGSCVSNMMPPQAYIAGALKFRHDHNLLQILKSAGIFPDGRTYPVEKIQRAVWKFTKTVVDIVCGSDAVGNVFLLEINQCISRDGTQFTDCDNNIQDCDKDPIFPDPLFT